MSQRDFLRAFDSSAFAGFRQAGLADGAKYTGAVAGAVSCSILVDRDVVLYGQDGSELAGRGIRVTLQKGELGDSQDRRGHRLDLVEGGVVTESWQLQELEAADASSERWWVVPA